LGFSKNPNLYNNYPQQSFLEENLNVDCKILYKPAFAAIFVTLKPGESITAEAGAMTSADGRIAMTTEFFGGVFSALLKKFFGGESLFVNCFSNPTSQPLTLVLTQSTIGDILDVDLRGKTLCFQPGAYICHTPGINLGVQWAGLKSWFSGEGLFKLKATGNGKVFFGAYGGLTKKRIQGEFIVDTGHLVAYEYWLGGRVVGIDDFGGRFYQSIEWDGGDLFTVSQFRWIGQIFTSEILREVFNN
jgi:uncharacterized protein (TIGR00266 family)